MPDIKMEDVSQDGDRSAANGEERVAQSDNAEDVWDEEQLQGALDTLKEMYIQLRGLRTSIPRLVAPLTVKQLSPEILFQKFAVAATTANEELKQFKHLIDNDESKKIFEHVRESRAQNPKGITPWRISEHPDWLTREDLN